MMFDEEDKNAAWNRFRGENFSNVTMTTDNSAVHFGRSNIARTNMEDDEPLDIREEDPLELM